MEELLNIGKVTEIFGLDYKSVCSCALAKQSSQALVIQGVSVSETRNVINTQDTIAQNLVQKVKIGYFLTADPVLTIGKN
jgi:hypothetical protein